MAWASSKISCLKNGISMSACALLNSIRPARSAGCGPGRPARYALMSCLNSVSSAGNSLLSESASPGSTTLSTTVAPLARRTAIVASSAAVASGWLLVAARHTPIRLPRNAFGFRSRR